MKLLFKILGIEYSVISIEQAKSELGDAWRD